MKIQYISDIHIDFQRFKLRHNPKADVIVIAGDFANLGQVRAGGIRDPKNYVRAFIHNVAKAGKPVVTIPGNHEWYGLDIAKDKDVVAWALGRGLPGVHFLDDSCTTIDGVKFYGTTLWASLDWFGREIHNNGQNPLLFNDFFIPRSVGDFHATKFDGEPLTTDNVRQLHASAMDRLRGLCGGDDPPQVVVSHFAPCKESIHAKYEDNPINPFFVNDIILSDFPSVKLWIHGHVHNPFSYEKQGCRVRCNPRGYPGEKSGFNTLTTEEL